MTTVKLSGFKELESELNKLTKRAGKGALQRALIKAATPMADLMRSLAPDDPRTANYDLEASIGVGTKLSPRQAGLHKRMFRDDRAAVEVFVGAGAVPQATQQEFGNINHGPQPFARPAWDAEAMPTLERLKPLLWDEVSKGLARAARKSAKG